MGQKLTKYILIQSLVLFLIYEVRPDTKESALEIYNRWKEKYQITLHSPETVVFVLEFFEAQKHYRRDSMIEAAIIDGFISN